MLRAEQSELLEIVGQLASRSRARVDAARARLSIVGARAVGPLVDALEGDDHRIRARAMPILALIQDPRGREPLTAMLLDRSARLREIAARALARFPSSEVVAALNRVSQKDRSPAVRVAAVQSLVEQYAAGQESAICRVLDVLTNTGADVRLRTAAFALLPALRSSARKGVIERLIEDPEPAVRSLAARWTEQRVEPALELEVERLGSDDFATWNDAVHRLGACGPRIVPVLVAMMQRRAGDPEYCARAGMALKALGPRRGRAVVDTLERIDDPLPLQVLVEVVGAMGEKSMIYRLRELIERLARVPAGDREAGDFDPLRRVRAKAHLELARIGSRVAIHDLCEMIEDPARRIEAEALEALALIGKRDEVGVLLAAFGREHGTTRVRIAEVVHGVMRRERIRRNDRVFRSLSREQHRALDSIRPRAAAVGSLARRPPRAAGL